MDKRLKIGIQGIEGCFHHEAACRFWNDQDFEVVPAMSFEEEIKMLKDGVVDSSIIAIENSLAGSIIPNYQLIRNSGVRIVGEISHHIGLNLLAIEGTKVEDLREVSSHPMALRQCASFLDSYPEMRRVETADTADSAKRIKDGGLKNSAAVAGALAAKTYGLKILYEGIESHTQNFTRFLVVRNGGYMPSQGSESSDNQGGLKMSVYFQTLHKKGSLANVLNALSARDVNLSKLQSHPVPSRNQLYGFYADLEIPNGDSSDSIVEELSTLTSYFDLLGVYQKDRWSDE